MNIIEKSGTWYSYKDERIGQGREAARSFLKERPEMIKNIREEILKKAGIGANPNATAANAVAAAAGATQQVRQ